MGSAVGSLIPPGARSFGKYELLARLATGGMAEIFLARGRQGASRSPVVVIKRILPHLADDARFVAMFRDEARLASRIEHVNVCQVLELGSVGDTYFIAMEYLHGVPLSRVLLRSARTRRELPLPLIASIIGQSCAGLHHAHELTSHDGRSLDVVHRDVSPPNIFVTDGGVVKLLDFGVAKARGASQKTRTGTVKGKNAYMSPEQVLGEAIDRRSDVFSLGIVLWESLTASRLFMRETDFETFRAITRDQVPDVRERRPDTPPALAEVVARALERDRDRRFATALELGDALAGAVAELGGPAGDDAVADHVRGQFGKELAGKQQLLAQATEVEDPGAPGTEAAAGGAGTGAAPGPGSAGTVNPGASAAALATANPGASAAASASANPGASAAALATANPGASAAAAARLAASAVAPLDAADDEDATVVDNRPPVMDMGEVRSGPSAPRRRGGPRSVGVSGEIAAVAVAAASPQRTKEPEVVVELGDAEPAPAAELVRAAWLTLAGAAAVCALAALLWWLW